MTTITTSNDILPLYLRCIQRDDKGNFVDMDARDQLADLAWNMKSPASRFAYGVQRLVNGVLLDFAVTDYELYGRHAPLVSLDCAACVKVPDPIGLEMSDYLTTGGYITCTHDVLYLDAPQFFYENHADRATAECAARVYANLKATEVTG